MREGTGKVRMFENVDTGETGIWYIEHFLISIGSRKSANWQWHSAALHNTSLALRVMNRLE